ncbi:MAG: hypothetical protein ACPGC9_02270 [Cytophagales bacterium]
MKRRYQHIKLLLGCFMVLFYLPFAQASEHHTPPSPPQQLRGQLSTPEKQDVINVAVATVVPLALRVAGGWAGASSTLMLNHNAYFYLAGAIPVYAGGKEVGRSVVKILRHTRYVQDHASQYHQTYKRYQVQSQSSDNNVLETIQTDSKGVPISTGRSSRPPRDSIGYICHNLYDNYHLQNFIEYSFGMLFLGLWAVACYVKFSRLDNQTLVEHLISDEKGDLSATRLVGIILPPFSYWILQPFNL